MESLVTVRVGNPWVHWAGSLGGITGNLEGGEPMGGGSLVTLRVISPWDHWAGSVGGVTGNFEAD